MSGWRKATKNRSNIPVLVAALEVFSVFLIRAFASEPVWGPTALSLVGHFKVSNEAKRSREKKNKNLNRLRRLKPTEAAEAGVLWGQVAISFYPSG